MYKNKYESQFFNMKIYSCSIHKVLGPSPGKLLKFFLSQGPKYPVKI